MRKPFLATLLVAASMTAVAGSAPQIYSYKLKTIDGLASSLQPYKGKVLLLVNTASGCGYTPQYKGLEALYEKYKGQGLVIVGLPANNFAGQEPGTNAEIKTFCTRTYHVSFPMMAKISVKGADEDPLYGYLTSSTADPKFGGPIQWNFTKFLIGRDGQPVARFEPAVTPESPQVTTAIEAALKQ